MLQTNSCIFYYFRPICVTLITLNNATNVWKRNVCKLEIHVNYYFVVCVYLLFKQRDTEDVDEVFIVFT